MKSYSGGTGSVHTASARPPSASTSRTTPSVAPTVSASGFSWLTASTRRALRQAVHDGLRDGVEVRSEVDAHRDVRRGVLVEVVGRGPGRRLRGRGGTTGRTADGGSSPRSSVWWTRATGVGSDSADGHVRVGRRARLDLGQELEDPGAALGGVVEMDVQIRDPLDPQALAELVPDERHGVAERLDRGVAFGRLADDAHPDLGVAQVLGRLDIRDRDEPDPRIRHVPRDDRADLLPEQLVDVVSGSAGSPPGSVRRGSAHGLRGEALDDVALPRCRGSWRGRCRTRSSAGPRGRRRGTGAATRSGPWR